MPAIPSHSTETSNYDWDGPANESRLKLNQSYAFYRRAYAWNEADGDLSKKASYRFIHHMVDREGVPGAANVWACITGIGVLNGARGGTTIPKVDYKGVWRHLARHIKDADKEPPELKSEDKMIEYRDTATSELRVVDGTGPETKTITGYAAVFEKYSEGLRFLEKVKHGAFAKSIQNKDDIRLLINHEGLPLARTRTGTLRLSEDDNGLWIEGIVEVSDPDVQRILPKMRRKDLDQMSIGFYVTDYEWVKDDENGQIVRVIKEASLVDVSIVTFPAYPQTSVSIRSADAVYDSYIVTMAQTRQEAIEIEQKQMLKAQQRERKLYLSEILLKER